MVDFNQEMQIRTQQIKNYLIAEKHKQIFQPAHIQEAVYSYINRGGKLLRPSLLLLACGAAGGDEEKALPAAAAIEIFHTWTLVHDDLIDQDTIRRGGPSIHQEFTQKAIQELAYEPKDAQNYGYNIGILSGDLQHGWAISLLTELSNVNPEVTLYLIKELEKNVLARIIAGQTLDIQLSRTSLDYLSEDIILDMLAKKTAALFQFAGQAGAMIGLNYADPKNDLVKALSTFSYQCGLAFQLQDDILGITSNQETLGKPIGSDIREGKKTTIIYHAFKNAQDDQKDKINNLIGKKNLTPYEFQEIKDLLIQLGGIEYTRNLSNSLIQEAIQHLNIIPEAKYKNLLSQWAQRIIHREK